MKDFLGYENARNKQHAATFTALMQAAFGGEGVEVAVLIGHHLTFELNKDLNTENEIPSADCLMFDHDIMTKVFGDDAQRYMVELVLLPCDRRDDHLAFLLEARLVGASA